MKDTELEKLLRPNRDINITGQSHFSVIFDDYGYGGEVLKKPGFSDKTHNHPFGKFQMCNDKKGGGKT